jgi:allophanate hydrolase
LGSPLKWGAQLLSIRGASPRRLSAVDNKVANFPIFSAGVHNARMTPQRPLPADDGAAALSVAAAPDPTNVHTRVPPHQTPTSCHGPGFRFGIPDRLNFFGHREAARLFDHAVAQLEATGGRGVFIHFAPVSKAGLLLYEGPWVAERLAAVETFLVGSSDALHPITRQIIAGGASFSAVETLRAFYRLQSLRAQTRPVWDGIDCLIVPTAPTICRIDAVEADPIRLNTHLGLYTNFVNVLNLAAIAVPSGFRADGIPMGISLVAPAFHDDVLVGLAIEFQRRSGLRLGSTNHTMARERESRPTEAST